VTEVPGGRVVRVWRCSDQFACGLTFVRLPSTGLHGCRNGLPCVSRLDFIYLRKRADVLHGDLDVGLKLLFVCAIAADIVFGLLAWGVFAGRDFAVFGAAETLELVVMCQYFIKSTRRNSSKTLRGDSNAGCHEH
jgi:hypothetical protein